MNRAIQVQNLSKLYRIGLKERMSDSLGGAIVSWLKSPLRNYRALQKLSNFSESESEDVIWALRDISFEIGQGEIVGIIGRNGAGKSTLLKIFSRITFPTSGRVVIRGRVSSLLEVGTGFHQDLTGRENVYLNGVILGMSKKEIDRKFDEIVSFSEVEKFIDTPVKRYSSGMKVRLAFAIAAHLEPEIMLVDEVLAVGDTAFQKKCLGKIGDVAKGGRTILFVSHDMNAIQRLCSRCVLLNHSRIAMDGEPNEVITSYLRNSAILSGGYSNSDDSRDPVVLRSAGVFDLDGNPVSQLMLRQPFEIRMIWERRKEIKGAFYFIMIHDSLNRLVTSDNTRDLPVDNESEGLFMLKARIDPNRFAPGLYYISFGCHKWRVGNIHFVSTACELDISNISAIQGARTFRAYENSSMLLDSSWTSSTIQDEPADPSFVAPTNAPRN